ncbi:hypothetical protein ANN_25764 [Periplaneta americana]|uniref:RNase H type-1 domain-containing protein n=1 Tax=Periplaneta americana TaxID=6978 RepID=A0ABQ8S427_PERAM|nr:hypothetical protein ANN_25764 [Periplaneta americana]
MCAVKLGYCRQECLRAMHPPPTLRLPQEPRRCRARTLKFKMCLGSLYAVMWLADEPREFNLPILPQRCITYEAEKLASKYGVHSEEYVPIRTVTPVVAGMYPPQNWLHLYTDGSLISREQDAGAGVTCCLFSLYRSLGYGTTSFDGEIIAISESLRNLLCHINKFKNAVILPDSKAAILSIVSKHTPSSQTAEITKMLSQLISLNKRIVFQWIPSHCGILGNENADALAKHVLVNRLTGQAYTNFLENTIPHILEDH